MPRTREQNRLYYLQNKEDLKARAKQYYYAHREKKIAYAINYDKQHRPQKYAYNDRYRKKIRRLLLELLGNKCAVCGTLEYIELDHLNGFGTKDRKWKGSNWSMYRYYWKHPEEAKQKLQLLCKSHNLKKEFDNHERWY